MKIYFLLLVVFIMVGCSKPKTVLICGDHVCINKAEAEQFFEENLTIEVKVLDNKEPKNVDLVEINLKSNQKNQKKISVISKKQTNKKLKVLTKEEIKDKKKEVSLKRKSVKKLNKKKAHEIKEVKNKPNNQDNIIVSKSAINIQNTKITDICVLLEKCNIEEISKLLVKQGMNKKFPDITYRNNNE